MFKLMLNERILKYKISLYGWALTSVPLLGLDSKLNTPNIDGCKIKTSLSRHWRH
jgi:hypothetical protein